MWPAIFGAAVVAIWAVAFATLLLTGGLRTRNGNIIGRQKTPEQLNEMVARVKAREARREKRL